MVASRLFPILFSPPLFSSSGGDTHNGLPEKEKKKPPKKGRLRSIEQADKGEENLTCKSIRGEKGEGRNICSQKKRVKKWHPSSFFFLDEDLQNNCLFLVRGRERGRRGGGAYQKGSEARGEDWHLKKQEHLLGRNLHSHFCVFKYSIDHVIHVFSLGEYSNYRNLT